MLTHVNACVYDKAKRSLLRACWKEELHYYLIALQCPLAYMYQAKKNNAHRTKLFLACKKSAAMMKIGQPVVHLNCKITRIILF